MTKRNTKQAIITEALSLFSTRGYAGVSVKEIAQAVGVKDSSLYKHFKSKEEIFSSILDEMDVRYESAAAGIGMEGSDPAEASAQYGAMGLAELQRACRALFLYFLQDEYASKVRRMLTIEQYKNPTLGRLYVERYIDAPLAFQGQIFSAFKASGAFAQLDTGIAAMQFYGPIYLMLCQCDAYPEQEKEVLEKINAHVAQFTKLYITGDAT